MNSLIIDTQRLVSASRNGHKIPTYDDGFGELYIHRNSMGISGIVRAMSFEDAYEICEDEFFDEAYETVEDLREDCNFDRKHIKIIKADGIEREAMPSDYPLAPGQFVEWKTIETPCEEENGWVENELFQDAFGFRPSGANARDKIGHGIYSKDLNGDRLEVLTKELADALDISLVIENED